LSEAPQSIVIVTGLSGSGKSYVTRCFEDMGYFCVDNLPLSLVDMLLEDLRSRRTPAERIAVVLDVRNPNFAERFPDMFRRIKERFPWSRLVFLDASEEALIRRFSETRRPHPLAGDRARGVAARTDAARECARHG
jgi:RNase adapter protein RapZ